jgi:hypothetical protein
MFPGIADRIEKGTIAFSTPRMKIKALSSEERKYVVSVGGSILLTEHIHTDRYHQNEH